MSDNNDFKTLWNQQPQSAIPDASELFEKANRLKKKTKRTLWRANILLAATGIFILYIVFSFHPEMITTKIGVILVIVSMVTYLIAYNRAVGVLSGGNVENNTKEYLSELILL
jgi:uncharacterized membrane protein YidH (DUF202 family)